MAYRRILIAVDGSEFAMNAARRGLELARQLKASAALLFVIDVSRIVVDVDAGIQPGQTLAMLKREAIQTLDQLAEMYDGTDLVKLMPEGHPRQEILNTAMAWEADLIVCGTHSRKGLAHLLLGSNAEYIVRHSPLPVMVVPLR